MRGIQRSRAESRASLLYPPPVPAAAVHFTGNFTPANFVGMLSGQTAQDFINGIRNGSICERAAMI